MFNRNQNTPAGSIVDPTPQPQMPPQPFMQPPAQPTSPTMQPQPVGQPAQPINPAAINPPAKKRNASLIETIILIVVSLIAATFIGLFIYMYVQWDEAHTNVQGQIDEAVAIAVEENTTDLQSKFEEEEKYPYKTFTGPEEYGSLSFEYPKTWSVYVAQNNSEGGNFEVYFNPDKVMPISTTTVNALRFSIVTQSVDSVTKSYDSNIKKGTLSQSAYQFTKTGESANFYEGELPSSKFQGSVVVFKLRDKTAIIQTDAQIFRNDFIKLLSTVTYTQ